MTWEKVNGLIRHLLTLGGGYVVGAGVLPQAEADLVSGALMTVAGVAWSLLAKKKEA